MAAQRKSRTRGRDPTAGRRLLASLGATLLVLSVTGCRIRREVPKEEPLPTATPVASEVPAALKQPPVEPPAPPPAVVPDGAALVVISGVPTDTVSIDAMLAAVAPVDLEEGPTTVASAVAALERTGAFPAGLGARERADGKAYRDAVIVDDSGGLYGVVAATRVGEPTLVVLELLRVRSTVLYGDGVAAFAEQRGIDVFPLVSTALLDPSASATSTDASVGGAGSATPNPQPSASTGSAAGGSTAVPPIVVEEEDNEAPSKQPWMGDGVAAVARTADGGFAAAASAGGSAALLPGEQTALTLPGYAVYASSRGAVAVVFGAAPAEPIARKVHDRMLRVAGPEEAVSWALQRYGERALVLGVIAVDAKKTAVATEPPLAWLERAPDGDRFSSPPSELVEAEPATSDDPSEPAASPSPTPLPAAASSSATAPSGAPLPTAAPPPPPGSPAATASATSTGTAQ